MVFQERNCIPFTQKIITAGISRQDDYEVGNAFKVFENRNHLSNTCNLSLQKVCLLVGQSDPSLLSMNILAQQ